MVYRFSVRFIGGISTAVANIALACNARGNVLRYRPNGSALVASVTLCGSRYVRSRLHLRIFGQVTPAVTGNALTS